MPESERVLYVLGDYIEVKCPPPGAAFHFPLAFIFRRFDGASAWDFGKVSSSKSATRSQKNGSFLRILASRIRKNTLAEYCCAYLYKTVGGSMLKFLLAIAASVAMVGGAMAADLPRSEPPPVVAAPVGKAPIGKLPFGKGPVVARY